MRVESLAAEAQRRLETVKFTGSLSSPTFPRAEPPPRPVESEGNSRRQSYPVPVQNPWSPPDQVDLPQPNPNYMGNTQGFDRGRSFDSSDGPVSANAGPYLHQGGPVGQDIPPLPQQPLAPRRSVDDFGVTNVSPSNAGGGRFVTFPVRNNRAPLGPSLSQDERALTLGHRQSDSFSSSIAAAMGQDGSFSPVHRKTGSIDSSYRPRRSIDGDSNPMSYVPPGSRLPDDPWKDETSIHEEPLLAYTQGPSEPHLPQLPNPYANQGGSVGKHVRFGAPGLTDESSEINTSPAEGRGRFSDPPVPGLTCFRLEFIY